MDSSNCPVTLTTHIIGGKWKPSILYYLQTRIRRFSELQRLLSGPTKKMLTQQLRELERDNIINRKVYAQVPPKVEYSFTDWGQALCPALDALLKWVDPRRHSQKRL